MHPTRLKSAMVLITVMAICPIANAKEAAKPKRTPLKQYPQCEVNLARYSDAVGGPLTILEKQFEQKTQNYSVSVPVQEQKEKTVEVNGVPRTVTETVTKYVTEERMRTYMGFKGRQRFEIAPGHYRIFNKQGKPVELPANVESLVLTIKTHDVEDASLASWPRLFGSQSLLARTARIVLYNPDAMRQVPESQRETNPQTKAEWFNRFPQTDITLVERSQSNGDLEFLKYSTKHEEIERTKTRIENDTVEVNGRQVQKSREVEYSEIALVERPDRRSMRIPQEYCVILQHDSKRSRKKPVAPLSDKRSFAVVVAVDDLQNVSNPDWDLFRHGTPIVFYNPKAVVPVDQPKMEKPAADRPPRPRAKAQDATERERPRKPKASDGTSVPQEVPQALKPLIAEVNIAARPILVQDATLKADLPGFTFYVIGDPVTTGFKPFEIIFLSPQGSTRSTSGKGGAPIANLLRDIFKVRTERDAKRYVRTHLTLIKARHRKLQFSKISPINVTPNPGGGLRAAANMRVVSSQDPNETRTGFEIDVRFDRAGKLDLASSKYRFTRK